LPLPATRNPVGCTYGTIADFGTAGTDAPSEGQADRHDQRRAAADELSTDTEDQCAVERKVLGMGDDALACFSANEEHRFAAAPRGEDATAETITSNFPLAQR